MTPILVLVALTAAGAANGPPDASAEPGPAAVTPDRPANDGATAGTKTETLPPPERIDDVTAPRSPDDAPPPAVRAAYEADSAYRYANAAVAATAGAGLVTAAGAFGAQQALAAGFDVEALQARLIAISLFGLVGVAGGITLAAVAIDLTLATASAPPDREAFTWGRDAPPAALETPAGDLDALAAGAVVKRWVLFAAGLCVGTVLGGSGAALLFLGFGPDDRSGRINLPLVLSMSGAALVGAGVTAGLSGLVAPFVLRSDAEFLLDEAATE